MSDLYNLFNISKDKFSNDDLKKSYRKLALANHPDRLRVEDSGTTGQSSIIPISRIIEGYEILSKYRVCYDFFGIENLSILQEYFDQAQSLFPGMDICDAIGILNILVDKEVDMIGILDRKNVVNLKIKILFGFFWIWILCKFALVS